MYSVSEVARKLGVPDKRLYRWIREEGVGTKVGFAVILSDADIIVLRRRIEERVAA